MDDRTRLRQSELLERSARLRMRSQVLHRRLLDACARAEEVIATAEHLRAQRAERDRLNSDRAEPPG